MRAEATGPGERASGPLVSVLLPVRDGEPWLESALASLRAQTLDDVEVIAVDDGSTDATPAILERAARRGGRLRVLRQEPAGLVAALERGRDAARGRYLARMDADDVALPERLERQHDLMETRPELVGCGCRVAYFPPDRVRGGARRYQRWLNALVEPEEIERDVFVECPLAHPTFFLRTDAVESVGGYRDAGWPEDYDLLLRLREAGGRFAKVPEVLLEWREGPERLSRTDPAYAPEAFRRCKIHFLKRGPLVGRHGVVVWGSGPTGKAFARSLRTAGVELRAFVDLDPRKIGQEIHGAPVVDPDGIAAFRDAFCVAAVGQAGARTEIREALRLRGWEEGRDFVAVA